MSSSQLTFIFFRGVGIPPTSIYNICNIYTYIYISLKIYYDDSRRLHPDLTCTVPGRRRVFLRATLARWFCIAPSWAPWNGWLACCARGPERINGFPGDMETMETMLHHSTPVSGWICRICVFHCFPQIFLSIFSEKWFDRCFLSHFFVSSPTYFGTSWHVATIMSLLVLNP